MSYNRKQFIKSFGTIGILASIAPTKIHAQQSSTNSLQFTSSPYLQNFTDKTITIFSTFNKPCFAWVELIDETNSVIDTIYQTEDGMRNTNTDLFKFKINHHNKNIKYRVVAKDIIKFEPYKVTYGETIYADTITTELPFGNKGNYNILILNDIHEYTPSYSELYDKSSLPKKDLIILNGDCFHYINNKEDIIDKLNKPASEKFASKKPYILTRGNHETRGSYARQLKNYLDYPYDKFYHTIALGSLLIIVLDGSEDKPDSSKEYSSAVAYDDYRLTQKEWLRKVLQSDLKKKAKHTVIINHIPWVHSDDWHGTKHNYECFHQLAHDHQIDAVISGHTHKAAFYPPSKEHNYYVIIGAGPKVGERTFIEISLQNKTLVVALKNEKGETLNSFTKN